MVHSLLEHKLHDRKRKLTLHTMMPEEYARQGANEESHDESDEQNSRLSW